MTKNKYEIEMAHARAYSRDKEQRKRIKDERNKWKTKNKIQKKIETSKIIVAMVFAICLEILIFSQIVMIVFHDTSALYTLISVPVTLIPTLIMYFNKSKAENLKKIQGAIDNGTFISEEERMYASNTIYNNDLDDNGQG